MTALSGIAIEQLSALWTTADPQLLSAQLFEVLPIMLDTWGLSAATVGADWYDSLRGSAEVVGNFSALAAQLPDIGAESLAGWASEPLLASEPDLAMARYRVEGGFQKRLMNTASHTITRATVDDPQARGYMRRTRSGACRFCVMVASRGGVFTKASSTFACHEHCFCEAVPAWGGRARPVAPYKPSDKPATPEDRARVRKWIADNL